MLWMLGCDRAVTTASSETATWEYVQSAWGGAKVDRIEIDDDDLVLTLALNPANARGINSAICACGVEAVVRAKEIHLNIRKCICGPEVGDALEVRLPRPPGGFYQVVYDDAAAGNPHLGGVDVR